MKKPPSGVERAFLNAMTFAVSTSSLVLANAEGASWPAAFTPVVAITAHLLVDRYRLIRLPVIGANLLGIAAFAAMLYEFIGSPLLGKLLSGAHLIVYMTWVVLLLQKGIRQFWWLAALSLLQISVASVLTNSPQFGAALVGMLLVMIWMLSVFTLYRAELRLGRSQELVEDSLNAETTEDGSVVTIRNGLQIDTDERWIGWRFRFVVAFAFVASLFVGVIAFAVFPRVWVPGSALAGINPLGEALFHQTGFTDTVSLGEIGRIMQSDTRVLQFEISRMTDDSAVSTNAFASQMNMDEILFRGNAMGIYADGRWTDAVDHESWRGEFNQNGNSRSEGRGERRRRYNTKAGDADFRIRITQDVPIGTYAFSPVPVTNVINRDATGQIFQRRFTFALVHRFREERSRTNPVRYEVWCKIPSDKGGNHLPHPTAVLPESFSDFFDPRSYRRMFEYAAFERQTARRWCLTEGLHETLPELHKLANNTCSVDGTLVSESQRLDRILRFLNSTGGFSYSLNASVNDSTIDPMEDFVIKRRVGHCEYFASACALMLQSVGIPARVVNGYKGSEVNSVTGRAEVKQKHAHTWVEAYVNEHWETLDPTPVAAREENMTKDSRLDWWGDLRLALTDGWYGFVQSMSLQRQEALVQPWIAAGKQKLEEVKQKGIWESLKLFYHDVILKPEKWISVQGWVTTFFLLLLPALAFRSRLLPWLRAFARSLRDRLKPESRQQRNVVRFYENFKTLCVRNGLVVSSNQTAMENANHAVRHFADVLVTSDDKALPPRIAATFNRVRFGNTQLTDEAVDRIRNDVSRLKELLSARKRPGQKTARN